MSGFLTTFGDMLPNSDIRMTLYQTRKDSWGNAKDLMGQGAL